MKLRFNIELLSYPEVNTKKNKRPICTDEREREREKRERERKRERR